MEDCTTVNAADDKVGSITVALFQGFAELGNVPSNLDKMKRRMREAKKMGADLIVFPELFTVGYNIDNSLMRKLAEKKNGKMFTELSKCANEMDIGVLYGYPELSESEDCLYNSVQFLDKRGLPLANYHKTHLWLEHGATTEAVFTPGNCLPDVFEFCGIKIGLLICFDIEFGEAARVLALRGADAILVPTASSTGLSKMLSGFLVASRAYENGVYIVYVNHSSEKLGGMSRCYDPKGEALISCGPDDEGIFLAEIKKVEEVSYYLTRRRPELYGDLMQMETS